MVDVTAELGHLKKLAEGDPTKRFDRLYRLLRQVGLLAPAKARIAKNKGAQIPGVDGRTMSDIGNEDLVQLSQELAEGTYQPRPVRRGTVPKKNGRLRLDGSKIHADVSKSQAVSYKRLVELEAQLRQEVNELFTLGERADQGEVPLPAGFVVQDEIALRQERPANLAQAKAVLEARAQERYEAEQTEYQAKLCEREEKARQHHRKPKPPEPGPRDKDQYNFTDPSRAL